MALSKQLEGLGSALKSQIMSDLNAWEDRRRSETQAGRGKKYAAKRARPQPLPEIARGTVVEMRAVRRALYATGSDVAREVSAWAIGVLAVFVSVADMKGNCKLSDLIGLPGAKAVFQLLVVAVESRFGHMGMEAAETALVDATLATTKDPRAVEWILSQYGATHSARFARCLHLSAIGRLAQGGDAPAAPAPAAAAAGSAGLAKAIEALAAAHPEENTRALAGILDSYRDAVCGAGDTVAEDDPQRYILSYMLQSQQSALLGNGSGSSSRQWLGEAIRREMREGFSRLLVWPDGATAPQRQPLGAAIDALFGDQGRRKRASDHPLDICRVLEVFALIGAVIDGASGDGSGGDDINGSSGDVHMQAADADGDSACLAFVDACRTALGQRIAREQALVILSQLPKTVKSMPQPVPNSLHEVVQRGARLFNNGPLTLPAAGVDEAEAACNALFAVLSASHNAACGGAPAAVRLRAMVCDAAPKLIEVLAARMDAPALLKGLVDRLVAGWPVEAADPGVALALYRSLLAVGECGRGLVRPQLLHAFGAGMASHRDAVHHAVSLLAMVVDHQTAIATDPAGAGAALLGVAEVVADLCAALVAHWPALWARCFADPPDSPAAWAACTALVQALARGLALRPAMPMARQATLTARALDELAAVQAAMRRPAADIDGMLALARALLGLACRLAVRPGIGRVATERLLQLILQRPSAAADGAPARPSDKREPDPMHRLAELLDGRLLSAGPAPDAMETAGRLLWQNAVRPVPRYPRTDMRNYDRADDAWTLARQPKAAAAAAAAQLDAGAQPLLVLALLAVVQTGGRGAVAALGQLLEEYYLDAIPSLPPLQLDERLERGRLQLLPVELELVHDLRRNPDLELLLVELLRAAPHGPAVARRLVAAAVVALSVVWNGALA
ncbi:hypothetical protein IWQ57_000835, partial [Coemansia nantahalensis]